MELSDALRLVNYSLVIVIKNMPWSPKSILSAHQGSHIPFFEYEVIRRFVPILRAYMHHPSRGLRRQIFGQLGSMFRMHHSRAELRSILRTLMHNRTHDRRFAARVWVDLNELREYLNELEESPPPSDDEL